MRATIQKKEGSSKKWIIPLIIFVGALLFEILLGNTLFYHSYHSIIGVQNFLNEKIGLSIFNNTYNLPDEEEGGEDKSKNNTFNESQTSPIILKNDTNFKNFVKDADGKIIFSELVHFFNTNIFFIMISAIAFNFVNVYKVFVLTYTIFLANFISSTLCFILHTPRPYMEYFSIKPIIMFNDWGSPNTQIVVLIAYCLTFYEVVIRNKRMDKSLVGKIIVFIIIGLIALLDIFLLFASGNIAYNQIIFSILIGVVTYQIIFLLFKAEINKSKQLYNFLKFKKRYYIIINIILFLFQFILNIFVIDKFDEDYYSKNIEEQQKRLFYSKFLNDNFNYRRFFYLNKGNFCDVICFAMNIVAFLSARLELYSRYKGDYQKWSSKNFERPHQEGGLLDVSEDDYSIGQATQWNHTKCPITICRLIAIIIFCLLSVVPSVIIYSIINSSEFNGYIFIITVPMFLLVFGIFYLFKVVLICLTNTDKNKENKDY